MSKAKDTLMFLATYNSWRRGDKSIEMQNPMEIGASIDDAVNLLRKYDELEQENFRFKSALTNIIGTLGENSDLSQAACMERAHDYAYNALFPKKI